jgi:hypothetical protein
MADTIQPYLSLMVDCQMLFIVTENHGVGGSIPPLGTIKNAGQNNNLQPIKPRTNLDLSDTEAADCRIAVGLRGGFSNLNPLQFGRLATIERRGLPGDPASSDARMLSLDGEWFACRTTSFGLLLWVEAAAQPIKGGMSCSPILLPDGGAVGVLCTGHQRDDGANAPLDSGTAGPNPMLLDQLPAWLVRGRGE